MHYFGFLGDNQEQILDKVTPVLDDILEAHAKQDYALFTKHLHTELTKKVSEKQFLDAAKATTTRLGTCGKKRFLAALRRDNRPMLLWVAKFSNSQNDVLISLIFDQQDDKPVVDWVWIE